MRIAVEGCSHGELDTIYRAISELEIRDGVKIDALLCCGDFQSVRNKFDLKCMAVPAKYLSMQSFHQYYSGKKEAPLLTIFIGGNHEASNYLQELPYGGWVAPNIYYLGYAGVVKLGDLRIGGMSGIYNGGNYLKGHFEVSPYDDRTIRSVYHIRNLEVFRLKQLSGSIDALMSHDWPRGIYNHGDIRDLLKRKPFFKEEIDTNSLGSRPAEDILKKLKPKYWFSGHLHVKFAAVVNHEETDVEPASMTKFLALDKCLPRRKYLQIIHIPSSETTPIKFEHDLEWLTILRLTNHLLSTKSSIAYMPGPGCAKRYNFTPTAEERDKTSQIFGDLSILPSAFEATACSHHDGPINIHNLETPKATRNPQTIDFCKKLGVDDPVALLCQWSSRKEEPTQYSDPFNMSEINTTMNKTVSEQTYFEDSDNGDIVFDLSSSSCAEDGQISVDLVDVSTSPSRSSMFSPPQSSTPFSLSAPTNDISKIDSSPDIIVERFSLEDETDSSREKSPREKPEISSPRPTKIKRRNAEMYQN